MSSKLHPTFNLQQLSWPSQLMQFCDDYGIPESECMPAMESLLTHFLVTWCAASVRKSAMKSLWEDYG